MLLFYFNVNKTMEKIPLTKNGYSRLEEELRKLKADERPNIADDLPAGHVLHLSAESKPVAELYVFDGQFLQALSDIAPIVSPYFPAPHGLHEV